MWARGISFMKSTHRNSGQSTFYSVLIHILPSVTHSKQVADRPSQRSVKISKELFWGYQEIALGHCCLNTEQSMHSFSPVKAQGSSAFQVPWCTLMIVLTIDSFLHLLSVLELCSICKVYGARIQTMHESIHWNQWT